MASGRRTKSTIKTRPKYKRDRILKGRKIKAKKSAAHKRGLNRSKAKAKTRKRKK
jgi:hypothetical protein